MELSLSRNLLGGKSFVLRHFLFDLKDGFLARPALRPGRRAVKVGRCTNLAVCSAFARPHLDRFDGDAFAVKQLKAWRVQPLKASSNALRKASFSTASTRSRRLLLFARFGAPDFGQVSRLACDTQNLSCFEMPLACLHRWSKQGLDRLVRARPLAAAPVIETTLMPFAR
jgi:hypothetical protein